MKSFQAKLIVVPNSIAFVPDVGTVELGELGPGAASGLTLIAREKPPCTGHYWNPTGGVFEAPGRARK